MPIRVFLITNFRLLLWSLGELLESRSPHFLLAGSSESCEQAAELIASTSTDVVLLDIDIGADKALPLVSALCTDSAAKILLLTRQEDVTLEDKLIISGARGLIHRMVSPEQLLTALEKVHEGQVWLDRAATARIFVKLSHLGSSKQASAVSANFAQLTEREQEIVSFIARNGGEPGKTIAKRLSISESTLRNHLASIYEKLGLANRHGLLAYAFEHGLTERPGQ